MNKEDESPDDFFDITEDEPYVKTLFILDNIQNSDTSEKKLQIQIDVCKYMFSKEYSKSNKVKFGIVTSGPEEGIRCTPTNLLQGLQIVLSNIVIANIGETNIFKVIKESILSLKDKHENEVHRIHCFLNENYYIPEEKIVKIKRMSNEYGVILDFFFICDYPADCEQYMELTSDYSICKIFNTNDTDDYLITKQIIDDLFDLYSIYIVINDDEDISINLIESENDILDYSDDSNEMIDDSNNKDDDDDDIEYDIMIDDGNQEGNMKIDENDKEEDAIIDENDNEDDDLGNKNKSQKD